MSRTTAQVRTHAAEKLGVLGIGQTIRTEISDDLDQSYIEVFNMLRAEGLANWGTVSDPVPDELVPPVVSLVAAGRATRYGVPADRFQRILLEASQAEDVIRKIEAPPKIGPTKINNF